MPMHDGMAIVNPGIEEYLESLVGEVHPVLVEMETLAKRRSFPFVGPQVGRLLHILVRATGARRILELGSGFGYSGLWMALALAEDGEIVLTDSETRNEVEARNFFKSAGLVSVMRFEVGDGRDVLARTQGSVDMVFNDLDKEQYPEVVDRVAEILRPGGLFISDNTLWYGRVASSTQDVATRAVRSFNRILKADDRFDTVWLPLRDGISLALRR